MGRSCCHVTAVHCLVAAIFVSLLQKVNDMAEGFDYRNGSSRYICYFPCPYFMAGNCRFGANCFNLHLSPEEINGWYYAYNSQLNVPVSPNPSYSTEFVPNTLPSASCVPESLNTVNVPPLLPYNFQSSSRGPESSNRPNATPLLSRSFQSPSHGPESSNRPNATPLLSRSFQSPSRAPESSNRPNATPLLSRIFQSPSRSPESSNRPNATPLLSRSFPSLSHSPESPDSVTVSPFMSNRLESPYSPESPNYVTTPPLVSNTFQSPSLGPESPIHVNPPLFEWSNLQFAPRFSQSPIWCNALFALNNLQFAPRVSQSPTWDDDLSFVLEPKIIYSDVYVKNLHLCKYYLDAGNCIYDKCPYIHGDLCVLCKKYCLHPKDPKLRRDHIAHCPKSNKMCNICFEVVEDKHPLECPFGLLDNCEHVFCLKCIDSCRETVFDPSENDFDLHLSPRTCPVCRKPFNFIIPSLYWISTKEKKEIVQEYR